MINRLAKILGPQRRDNGHSRSAYGTCAGRPWDRQSGGRGDGTRRAATTIVAGTVLLAVLVTLAAFGRFVPQSSAAPAAGPDQGTGSGRVIDLDEPGVQQIWGAQAKDQLGTDLAHGDFNADGLPDILAGAQFGTVSGRNIVGRAYGIFGRSEWPARIDLNGAGRDWSFMGAGREARMGSAVEVGDVNSDGIDDLIIGSILGDPYDQINGGAVYLVLGKEDAGGHVDFLMDSPDGLLAGDSSVDGSDQIGTDLAVGDFSGDGNLDIAVAAALRHNFTGTVFIFFGPFPAGTRHNLRDTPADVEIVGPEPSAFFGAALHAADTDGDGTDDLLVTGSRTGAGHQETGALYGFLGGPHLTGTIDLGSGGMPHFTVVGERETELGMAFSAGACSCRGAPVATGDLTGDGIGDIVVGAPSADRNRGRVYVIPGPAPVGSVTVTALSPLVLRSEHLGGRLGWTVAVGPLDADERPDLLVTAPWADVPGRPAAGRTYGVRGGKLANWIDARTPVTIALQADLTLLGPGTPAEEPPGGYGTAGMHVALTDSNGDGADDLHLSLPDAAPAGRRSVGILFRLPGPLLSAPPTPTATPSPTASHTRVPTETPSPTVTASPTATRTPTATATTPPSATASSTPADAHSPTLSPTASTGTPSPSATPGHWRHRIYLPLGLTPTRRDR